MSAIALSGSADEIQARIAFDHGSNAFNAFEAQLRARFDHAREPDSLNEANHFNQRKYHGSSQNRSHCSTNIITYDQKLGDRELLQILSLCTALECPAPSQTDS
ncbi:hypothetical protein [Candidatus Pelagisphaera phototrophica]|uniref:hypothetical protein n=1 Tax=Candidatus Pelagisphaera phototrophica TaxID=2684113 RepID=UPI0019EC316B|nr:hypothetical protein [Candidatus Pelagisphaera phototrophica]QXD32364.1 hypothetical protein GA004_01145 [Candidatus Pelagisphaera phototrophica]